MSTTISMPREGLDRCDCGSKYWDGDVCHSCGEKYRAIGATSLAHYEQRGYWVCYDGVYAGWYMIGLSNNRSVIRRKVGGRNSWHFACVDEGRFVADDDARSGQMTRWGWAQ